MPYRCAREMFIEDSRAVRPCQTVDRQLVLAEQASAAAVEHVRVFSARGGSACAGAPRARTGVSRRAVHALRQRPARASWAGTVFSVASFVRYARSRAAARAGEKYDLRNRSPVRGADVC